MDGNIQNSAQTCASPSVGCVALAEIAHHERASTLALATQIFFETANVKTFETCAMKHAYFNRWCGAYARLLPEEFLVARTDAGIVAGYLAGCLDSFAAAAHKIADDIFYYTPTFREAISSHPSHFHINVKPGYQGRGVGHLLTKHFVDLCREAGSPGIHVVTGAASPAIKFYESVGFRHLLRATDLSANSATLTFAIGEA